MKLLLQIVTGLVIGTVCGALIGAVAYTLMAVLFPDGVDLILLSSTPLFMAILGALFVGVPGGFVGLVVGAARLGKFQGAMVGAIVAALLVARATYNGFSDLRNVYARYMEDGYLHTRIVFGALIMDAAWLIGLTVAGLIVALLNESLLKDRQIAP